MVCAVRLTWHTQSDASVAPTVRVVVNSLGANGSDDCLHSVHLELPVAGLYVPGWQASHLTPFCMHREPRRVSGEE